MFKNKTVLVTGGTSGLGFEISKLFIKENANVIAVYVGDDKKAKQAEKKINSPKFQTKKLDVTDEEKVKEYMQSLKKLDCLVNCAGISIEAPFEDLSMESIKKVMDVNLYGKMICSKYALPLMKNQGGGGVL